MADYCIIRAMKLLSNSEIMALHKKYATNQKDFDSIWGHCQIVWEIAQRCAENTDQEVDMDVLRNVCLLHDIGAYPFMHQRKGGGKDKWLYPLHSLLGSAILWGEKNEKIPEVVYDSVRTHNLMGLTKEEIEANDFPMGYHDQTPMSVEGLILCYADRYHSKDPHFNNPDTMLKFWHKRYPRQVEIFKKAQKEFGTPDLEALSKKFGQPIK